MTEISSNILIYKIYKEATYGSLLCTEDGIPHPHPFSSVYLLRRPCRTKLNDRSPIQMHGADTLDSFALEMTPQKIKPDVGF